MDFDYKGAPEGPNMYKSRKEFIQLLRKNNIDPLWIKNKSLVQFTEKLEEKRADLQKRAEEMEQNLLT